MLNIILEDNTVSAKNIINDIEKAFSSVKLSGDETEAKILAQLEQARFIDKNSFRDRFGYKLHTTELSAGCKAALCVLAYKDNTIDLVECGKNARDTIIKLCTAGSIIIHNLGVTVQGDYEVIDAIVEGVVVKNVLELNEYIFDKRDIRILKGEIDVQ